MYNHSFTEKKNVERQSILFEFTLAIQFVNFGKCKITEKNIKNFSVLLIRKCFYLDLDPCPTFKVISDQDLDQDPKFRIFH